MSSLNSLILEIEKEKEIEKEEIKKSHNKLLAEMENKFKADLNSLVLQLEEELQEERKKRINNYKLDSEFKKKMNLLSIKEDILKELISNLKNETINSSFEKRKIFYQKRLKEIEDLSLIKRVFVSSDSLNEIKDFFPNQNIEIIKKELEIKDGFVIEGERFSFEVSISSFIDSVIEKNKEKLYNLFN